MKSHVPGNKLEHHDHFMQLPSRAPSMWLSMGPRVFCPGLRKSVSLSQVTRSQPKAVG